MANNGGRGHKRSEGEREEPAKTALVLFVRPITSIRRVSQHQQHHGLQLLKAPLWYIVGKLT